MNVTYNYGFHSERDAEGNFFVIDITATKYKDDSALMRGDIRRNRNYLSKVEITAAELGFLLAIAKDMGITIPTIEITESMRAKW